MFDHMVQYIAGFDDYYTMLHDLRPCYMMDNLMLHHVT